MRERAWGLKMTASRLLAVALLAALGACTHENLVRGTPKRVWASERHLDDAKACVIRALDAYSGSESTHVTHAAQVIEPRKIYEVRPAQSDLVTADVYYVRLEKIDETVTRISLFSRTPWRQDLTAALAPCGAR